MSDAQTKDGSSKLALVPGSAPSYRAGYGSGLTIYYAHDAEGRRLVPEDKENAHRFATMREAEDMAQVLAKKYCGYAVTGTFLPNNKARNAPQSAGIKS